MTRDDIAGRLAEHREAFATRNVDALARGHALEGTFESPAYGVVHGRDAIRNVYTYWYAAFPDFLLKWDSPVIDPPRAAVFWTFEGTAAGPFFGEVKPGVRVTMIGSGEYTYGEDGILSVRHVFDFSGLLVKTGALKIKPAS